MSFAPVLFLLGAVALSALGAMFVWLLNRPRKERFGSSIDAFNRDLDALAPPGSAPRRDPGTRQNAPGPRPSGESASRPAPGPRPRPRG